MENIDPPREVAGSAEQILKTLDDFGLRSEDPVLFQSTRREAHRALVDRLLTENKAYWCGCSRRDLPSSGVYPGTCARGLPPGKEARAVRLRVNAAPVRFHDRIQGPVSENLGETTGDFVIWRADGLPAYQLAVVADDAYQGVTEVVRGCDLLGSTARQVHVARSLGFKIPAYAHHAVAVNDGGKKLGKRYGSDPVGQLDRARALALVLRFLGHEPPDGLPLEQLWNWALQAWDINRVPRRTESPIPAHR